MNFCPIVPIKYLERLATKSKSHMVLAQFVTRYPEYRKFYQRRLAEGDTVILDNGAYEGEQLIEKALLKIALDLRPTVVVAPDVPNNATATLRKSISFLKLMEQWRGDIPIMFVIHATPGNVDQFIDVYQTATSLVNHVGFSKLTPYYYTDHSHTRRAAFAHQLKREALWNEKVHHHALGMLDGNWKEFKQLSMAGFESIDSSSPVWRPLHGHTSDQPWPDYTFDPAADFFSEENIQEAELQLEAAIVLCQSK